jgi:chemotaxis signal transduction protein
LAAAQTNEVIHRTIVFKLRTETFALPLDRIHKAVAMSNVYGSPEDTGVGLTIYQGREIAVIDVGQKIFNDAPDNLDASTQHDRFLILLHDSQQRLVALPIDSPPSILSLRASSLRPLPEVYLDRGKIKCVSSLAIAEDEQQPPIFLLDSEFLTAAI